MIQFSLTNLIYLYIALGMAALFGLWVANEWKRKRSERLNRKGRILCRMCAIEFEDLSDDPIPPCPHCQQRNERIPIREI